MALDTSPKALAIKLLAILDADRDRLKKIDRYIHGNHDDPYMPDGADAEYKLLARRGITNASPLLLGTPAQALYVDDYRAGYADLSTAPIGGRVKSFQMQHWQDSRMDARQSAIYRGALGYGHSFVLTEKLKAGVRSKGLSAMSTAALFEDPANDETPYAALTVTREPTAKELGKARFFDGKNEHEVLFKSYIDKDNVTVGAPRKHGATECPLTRFACAVDLEGRTVGVIEPMYQLQDRINQTVFDLLVTQTYASFKVRWATGMAPPLKRDENGDPVLDANGQPIPLPINHNQKRMLFGEDSETKFGTLDETPLEGFIASIEASFRHMAAISQTPPHHILGQIANLSAEALLAAETALARKVEEFRHAFGEAWERVFRLAGEMAGDELAATDNAGEVIWRDMEQRSLAQSADALGKLKDQLEIPGRGLWNRVPGVTAGELAYWDELAEENNAALALSRAQVRAVSPDGFGPAAAPVLAGAIV